MLFYISIASEQTLLPGRLDQITLNVTLHYHWLPTALLENCQGVDKTQANMLIDKVKRQRRNSHSVIVPKGSSPVKELCFAWLFI